MLSPFSSRHTHKINDLCPSGPRLSAAVKIHRNFQMSGKIHRETKQLLLMFFVVVVDVLFLFCFVFFIFYNIIL